MRAVVVGGSGFLGSHVADALSDAGHEVVIFDARPSRWARPDQTVVIGDLLDEAKVDEVVAGADVVYNFGGIADIEEARERPIDTVRYNVLGNVILAEAACRHHVRRFLFASSVYVYSQSGSFYRCSKQASELFIESYQATRGLDFTVLRYGSLYGPRSDARNGIYRFVRGGLMDRKIEYGGDGEEVREFIHVRDAARLSVEALRDEFACEVLVLTGQHPMKVRDFLRMLQEILGADVAVNFVEPTGEHYQITPYAFRPRVARKVVSTTYLDLGQGLLELVAELYDFHVAGQAGTTPL